MTVKGKEVDFAPWINRVLLGVVAYFLIEANVKFNKVIEKVENLITQQALSTRENIELRSLYEYQRGQISDLKKRNEAQDKEILELYKKLDGR